MVMKEPATAPPPPPAPTNAVIAGCTDTHANNYNPNATENDGSCTYNSAPTTPPTTSGGGGSSSGGSSGAGGYFITGTKVILSDGSEKNIEEIKVGDVLLGLDNSQNKVLGLVKPTLGERQLFGFNNQKGFVTLGHPFMTTGGVWKSIDPDATLKEKAGMVVGKLEIGDSIKTKDGEIKIKSIDGHDSNSEQTLHDFKLDGNNTYYADNYAVHNKGGESGF